MAHVVIPVIATVVMSLIEGIAAPEEDHRDRVMKVASDLCILAAGLAGGVLTHSTVADAPQHVEADMVLSPLAILLSVGLAAIIVMMRRKKPVSGWRALVAILLGGAALGLPIYHIVTMSH